MADQFESNAMESQEAWIIIGNYEGFGQRMATVAALRKAAAEKNLFTRREILKNHGIAI